MRSLGVGTGVVVLLVLSAAPAHPQEAAKHDGFWISFGAGGGWHTPEETISDEALSGASVFVRLGGSPSARLLVGGELIAWIREENDVTITRGNGTLTVLFYPSRQGGFFARGGVGTATEDISASSGSVVVSRTEAGFGSTLGLGYDFRLGRNFYVTPNVDLLFQTIDGETDTIFLITVGATWH